MKKVIAFAMTMAIVITSFAALPAVANAAFPDMAADHWAYAQVERLASEGTINGMPDGSFNPTGVVSRAEFVKMLGKSAVKFQKDFADVNSTHWAYDYIMFSQLDGDANGNFNPANAITRGEVANLLYKRYANGAKEIAPYYITSQGADANAVAWVYNTGLMIGADKLNLRLQDTLTRAEAAVLIVRAKDLNPNAKNNFIDNFSSDVYKNVYEGSNLFDTPYEENGNITYEELAAAAMRFEYKYRTPALNYQFSPKYDGDYAKYWDIACNNALDEKGYKSTKAEADKFATVDDAVAMLTLGAMNNSYIPSSIGDTGTATYSGVTVKDNTSKYAQRMCYAYKFGISLYANGNINPTKLITKKEVACIVMQYGLTFGTQIGYHCGFDSGYITEYVRLDDKSYPANRGIYSQIGNSIPNYVYEAPYNIASPVKVSAKDFVNTTAMIAHTYANSFIYMSEEAYEKGAEIYIDFYPTMSVRFEDMNEIFRVKITAKTAFDGMKLSDICKLDSGVSDRELKAGDSLWCDIAVNQFTPGMLYIDYELMTINQIIG